MLRTNPMRLHHPAFTGWRLIGLLGVGIGTFALVTLMVKPPREVVTRIDPERSLKAPAPTPAPSVAQAAPTAPPDFVVETVNGRTILRINAPMIVTGNVPGKKAETPPAPITE